MVRVSLFFLLLLVSTNALGQFQVAWPTTPQFDSYNTSPSPYPNGQVKMGATADDIQRQANANNPQYRYDAASNQRINQARIMEQMKNDPAYNPQLRNPTNNSAFRTPRENALYSVLKDVFTQEDKRYAANGRKAENFTSPEFAEKTKGYTDALKYLKDMLGAKKPLSVAEAYYAMENAYGESYLTHKEFTNILKQSDEFIRTWMQQNGLNIHDNTDVHYAIQKFLSERETITVTKQTKDKGQVLTAITHDPTYYDYNDYDGAKDHRNFFLTKCLATGMGQCNSMPAVYVCLAEGLGAKAYLSHAPQHGLVKYPGKDGKMRNYEATSNWDITDQWYLDDMFISKKAQQSGVYLQPMDSRQIVADCLLQLAFGYQRKFGGANGNFINECIKIAIPYFPKNNNIDVYLTYSNLYGYQLGTLIKANGITRMDDIAKYPEAEKMYQKWKANEDALEELGYQDNPPGLYEEMMKHQEFRGKMQKEYHISGKEKHDLFTEMSK
jgi:hypothetical protein